MSGKPAERANATVLAWSAPDPAGMQVALVGATPRRRWRRKPGTLDADGLPAKGEQEGFDFSSFG